MEPISKSTREIYHGGPEVTVHSMNDTTDDMALEAGDMGFIDDATPTQEDIDKAEIKASEMSDEEIKIKALKQATDICKLMADVDIDDIIDTAKKLAKFIKG